MVIYIRGMSTYCYRIDVLSNKEFYSFITQEGYSWYMYDYEIDGYMVGF